MTDEAMKKQILVAFEYSYLHDDWVNPLAEALDGVTIDQALWKKDPDMKSIWDIVLHVAVWNENIVERIRTGQPVRPTEEDWPPVPATRDEETWEASKKRLWESLNSIKAVIENTPLDTIAASHYGLGDLFCRFNHIAYHLGQITKLRECID